MIQALLVQRRVSSVRVAGSWMMPRLPRNSAALFDGDDIAEWGDAVLQRHEVFPVRAARV